MLFHFHVVHKRAAEDTPPRPGLCGLLLRDVVLAAPARQHPFRMFGEPFGGIVLAAHEARLQREVLHRTLLGARLRSGL